jgi:serine/threonine protein kinase
LDVTAVVAMARLSGDEVSANGGTQRLVGNVVAGNFRLLREIGAGGMGRVYEAEQLSLRKPVAVKILHRDLMSDATVVRRFEREARSAAQIEHPNLVRIIDLGEDKETGLLFIAMELVKGRDLGRVIEEDGPLSLDRIVRIMSQILSALEEAHGHGIIHRDLKPANIMLVERRQADEQVRVCDFGIAKSTMPGPSRADSMLTVRGLVCGTPEYMAPEQARGQDRPVCGGGDHAPTPHWRGPFPRFVTRGDPFNAPRSFSTVCAVEAS